jgi:glutathione S-transferase
MQLIGLLDSPYVRRVAISLQLLELPFEHRPLSVFRHFEEFHAINPVVKAPTLVTDGGAVLMDSTLILQWAETLAAPRTLMPSQPSVLEDDLRALGLALAACEKSVQLVYERDLRPPEARHQPWVDRVRAQMLAGFAALEADLARRPLAATAATISQAGLTCAVVWHFTQQLLPGAVAAADHPHLAELSSRAETLEAFRRAPHGEGRCALR